MANKPLVLNTIDFFKAICILIVVVTVIISVVFKRSTLKKSKSVAEAKIVVDDYLKEYDEIYQELCKKSRNDNLKGEFQDLQESISSVTGCGEKCINLSYSQQTEISNYAMLELKKNSHLMYLYNYNKIECW